MPIYQSTGTLTGTIERENLAAAQEYLTSSDMTQFLDDDLKAVIERIRWELKSDGHSYVVEVIARQELSEAQLKELADWVSGQNSDGLGEGFEQQSFAEDVNDSFDEDEDEDWNKISFDWKTNDSHFVAVSR